MNKKLLGVVDGQTVDSQEVQTGVPSQTLAVDDEVSTGIGALTGFLSVTDSTNGESAIFSAHVSSDAIVIAKESGSATINAAKDNASTLNVYVEGGVIMLQSKLAAPADVVVNVI